MHIKRSTAVRAEWMAAAVLMLAAYANAWADEPSLSILEPKSGATVTSPFKVRLAAHSLTTAPAGKSVPNSGHHHLLINHVPMAKGKIIPKDDTHIHLDEGQTETELSLPPGKYKLTAQFADGQQRSYGYMMSHDINIIVK